MVAVNPPAVAVVELNVGADSAGREEPLAVAVSESS